MMLEAAIIPAMVAGVLAAASDERSLFRIPEAEDFRLQHVERNARERDWPFSVDEGYVLCAWVAGQKTVYFSEALEDEPRTVLVSTDPFDIAFANIGAADLFSTKDISKLIPLLAPFERLGSRLCDQPRGTEVGPGEL